MTGTTVRTEWRDRVLVVTIDRPERRNAVDHQTLLSLRAAQAVAVEGDARVLVLTGEPPAFCAGADLTGVESGEFTRVLLDVLHGSGSCRSPASPPSTARRSAREPSSRSPATSVWRRRRAGSGSRRPSSVSSSTTGPSSGSLGRQVGRSPATCCSRRPRTTPRPSWRRDSCTASAAWMRRSSGRRDRPPRPADDCRSQGGARAVRFDAGARRRRCRRPGRGVGQYRRRRGSHRLPRQRPPRFTGT